MTTTTSTPTVYVISGPSAVGKSTVAKKLFARFPRLQKGITFTTRTKRKKSVEDKVMHHISEAEFRRLIGERRFIEWARVYGHYYGTDRDTLMAQLRTGPVLLNIDVQGALRIKRRFPRAVLIFIKPESYAVLRKRILSRVRRGMMDKADAAARLASARRELAAARHFDHSIVNRERRLGATVREAGKIMSERGIE